MVNASKSIGVVDYGSGNLRSVSKALEAVGASVALVTSSAQLDPLDAVVVPGVGAFGDCAQNLRKSGLWEPLIEWLQAGRPYLGICLGYQLLFESSEESPGCKGLGVLPGRVVRFQGKRLKVPHIGWNVLLDMRGPMFKTLSSAPYFYFVHSYFPVPADDAIVSARCQYGGTFAASVSNGSLHATQFHPEKSQSAGLTLLKNFLDTLR
ncbi:MAG TPA: imidazole glycerol phosphate synthase subunit HisH [Terrimicrobiaceae bacterium]